MTKVIIHNYFPTRQSVVDAGPFSAVRGLANKKKVDIRLAKNPPQMYEESGKNKYWEVEYIGRREGSKPGAGAAVLSKLHREADKNKKDVLLYPEKKALTTYYKKQGYVPIKTEFGPGMVRKHK